MRKVIITLIIMLSIDAVGAQDDIVERKLSLIKQVYNLEPKDCTEKQVIDTNESKIKAGEILFKSTLLSGNNDTSCQTCHLDDFSSTDGLPMAVGVGGEGEGKDRLYDGDGVLVQRNALSLKGRGSPHFTRYFWDGKVDLDGEGTVYSQFGESLSEKFESPLAVASMLPIIERDEFIGSRSFGFENEIQREVGDSIYYERYKAVSRILRDRILDGEDNYEILNAMEKAGVKTSAFDLSDIGNLISHFIADNFECSASRWDEYISGKEERLTLAQKRGAILFFGKGRCVSCHKGPFQSDFNFHSIGTPQGLFGPHPRHRDLGRAAVTLSGDDLYKFRTPPLNEVSKTAPYGHNGIFPTLKDVVVHHFNPIEFYLENPDIPKGSYFEVGKLNDSRDRVLSAINLRSESELEDLLSFLKAL